jgi:hypothetical protein
MHAGACCNRGLAVAEARRIGSPHMSTSYWQSAVLE